MPGTKSTGVDKPVAEQTSAERHIRPRMPHERDESPSDTANPASAPSHEVMRQAHDDMVSGKQDTDRGPVADRTYHELRKKK